MTPSKPFLFCLAITAAAAVTVLITPTPKVAAAQESLPMTTRLTPEMTDFFGLGVAYDRPTVAALVACGTAPACGASDSSRVRFIDAAGEIIAAYDDKPTTTIEQVRRQRTTPAAGVTESRTLVRRYTIDEKGRVVMNGTDSIVRINTGASPSTLVRMHRYTDVRYMVNDPRLPWPLTGLVVAELSNTVGAGTPAATHTASHAAANFDGTPFAHIITTGALTHRVNLQARLFETVIPAR